MLRLQDIIALLACFAPIVLSIVSLLGGVGSLIDISLITYSFNAYELANGPYVIHWYRAFFLRICRGTWTVDTDGTIISATDQFCETQVGGYHLTYEDSILSPDQYNSFWNYNTNTGKSLIKTLGPFMAILFGLIFAIITFVVLIGYLLRARRDSRAYVLAPALAATICFSVTAGWLYDIASSSNIVPMFWDAPPNPLMLSKITYGSIASMVLVLICQITLPWGTARAYRKKGPKGGKTDLSDEYMMDDEGLTQAAGKEQRLSVWVKEDNKRGEDGKRKESGRMQTPDSARDTSSVFTRTSMLHHGDEAAMTDRRVSVGSVTSARGRVRGSSFRHPLAQTATLEQQPPPTIVEPPPSPPSRAIVRENGVVGVAV